MRSVKAWATVWFWCELPENESDADEAFQSITDDMAARLNEREIAYAARGSFEVEDADTEPEE